jgi:hypothetical protein
MLAGTPFDEIELPLGEASTHHGSGEWSKEDEEVADYLKHHHFSLRERKAFVEESIERLASQLFQDSPAKCKACGGHLS